ncbi:hypothetical protein F7725_005338, partial [Dissostichus mawsoni]
MDVHIRYWDDGCVRARYLGSQFLGHGRAEDLLHHIKALQSKPGSRVGELSVLTFRKECKKGLAAMVKKVQEKSPLKFPVVRHIACLDPTNMSRDPEWCIGKMKSVVQRFLQDKQLAGGVSAELPSKLVTAVDRCLQPLNSHPQVTGGGRGRPQVDGKFTGPHYQACRELLRCGCKKGCSRQCKCVKAAIQYTALCTVVDW